MSCIYIRCYYSNGDVEEFGFRDAASIAWFVRNEGDHLVRWEYCDD